MDFFTSSIFAFDHWKILLGALGIILALTSQSATTMSWSEIPGIALHALTKPGLLEQNKSSIRPILVGSSWWFSNPNFPKTSITLSHTFLEFVLGVEHFETAYYT